MCGVAGFLSYRASGGSDLAARRRVLTAMGDAIAHRGPDDAQYYDDGHLALVFRRLSIIDVAGGAQPMANEDGRLRIAVNGEIYNHRALRAQLQDRHAFASASDSEAALHAWEEWGEESLARLQGMFAIVLWDRAARQLVLARDRLGIKPLYVCELPHGLLFASELKALLAHPQCPRALDWQAIDRPAIGQPCETSYLRGVELLPGGTLLRADAEGRVARRRWWDLADHLGTGPLGGDAGAYSRAYADLLEQVAGEHLQRDVGGGLLLSGGLDSSLLAALAARTERDFPCFTIVERSALLAGDTEAARRVTATLGLPWHPVQFDHRQVTDALGFGLERFEQAVWMMDSPRFDIEWLFKSELQRAARAQHPGLKVLLIGQGADEFAGGYSQRADRPAADWHAYLREEVEPNLAQDRALREGGMELLRYLRPGRGAGSGGTGAYHRMMLLMVRQLQHHNLWHEDRSSSWNSLEARVPFLDHRLVELLAGVPAALHEQLFWRKRIVRDAFARFAPGIVLRQPKIGFLDGADTASLAETERALALRVWPAFRERYLDRADAPFDAARLATLATAVECRGPALRQQAQQLLQCMAVGVFEAQCTGRVAPPAHAARTRPLPAIRAAQWPAVERAAASAPRCGADWHPREPVRWMENVEVLAPLARQAQGRFVFLRAGEVLGQVGAQGAAWLGAFLRNLGTAATADFSVQDWVDEYELPWADFCAALDLLASRGVIAPPCGADFGPDTPADTDAAPLAPAI